ncbi:FixJ family two-component response regulator [Bradyrhizobium sp. F1.13.1]
MTAPVLPTGGRILVLDDEAGIRQTISVILSSAGFEVICCADVQTLLTLVRQRAPRCILLDQVLPASSGIEVLKELRRDGCAAPVLIISGKADVATAVQALKQGANDFVEKPFRGPDLIARVNAALNDAERRYSAHDGPVVTCHFPGRAPLTARERDVLVEVASGYSTKEIARRLGLSPRTVEGHRVCLMRKLGAKNSAELVRLVLSPADMSARQ